jgi:DUF1016 N-terminal domain
LNIFSHLRTALKQETLQLTWRLLYLTWRHFLANYRDALNDGKAGLGTVTLKQKIRSAQLQALRSVNREQIALYLDIGRMIMDRQRGDTWGKAVVGNLANDLREEFPGLNGFSAANLWRMKNFYEAYEANEKLA